MVGGSLEIQVGQGALQTPVVLRADRTVYWPGANTLLAADLHLGKSETFAAAGAAMPASINTEMFTRLTEALRSTGAERIIILGDLLHAPAGLTEALLDEGADWRRQTTATLLVVPGNHDRNVARVVEPWDLTVIDPATIESPFAFHHYPVETDGAFTWAGHEHPAKTLRSGSDSVKVQGFVIGQQLGILPAFTRFAAGGGKCDQGSFFPIVEHSVLPPLTARTPAMR